MTSASESGEEPGDPPTPIPAPTPKRGAFPTPKSEVEKAKPYVPDLDPADDRPESGPPADVDGKKTDPAPRCLSQAYRSSNSMPGEIHAGPIPEARRDPVTPERARRREAHVAPIGAPPNFIMKPQKISMWGNDVHGDCVTAEEAFAKACNNPEIFIPDDEVIAWATRHGVLEGAYLTQVMTWMQDDGFADGPSIYDDGPYFSVNWTDAGTLQSAISRGPVKIGVAADQIENAWRTTGGPSGWFATGFHADGNEDHCVTLCGYGSMSWLAQQLGVQVPAGVDGTQPGYAMFTWNSIGIIDVPSMIAVTHEAWLRQPTTVTKTGWQQLDNNPATVDRSSRRWEPLPAAQHRPDLAVHGHPADRMAAAGQQPGHGRRSSRTVGTSTSGTTPA